MNGKVAHPRIRVAAIIAQGDYVLLARHAKKAGVDGLLCVDLPPEESSELKSELEREALEQIFLLAPTSGPERVRLVAQEARGFIYYVSVTGVTGARKRFVERKQFIK